MQLELGTPALLFSIVSLLILSFNNRFISIAQLIRSLYDDYKANDNNALIPQINKLRKRLLIIRDAQIVFVASLLLSVAVMLLVFFEQQAAAKILFSISLVLLITAIIIAIVELVISANALNILLEDIVQPVEKPERKPAATIAFIRRRILARP